MWTDTHVGGRRYGGYSYKSALIEVEYDSPNFAWAGDFIDFEKNPEMSRRLDRLLLGKKAPRNIVAFGETIVFKGETIARLHLKAIKERWGYIDFSGTSWAKEVAAMKEEQGRKEIRAELRDGSTGVQVRIAFRSRKMPYPTQSSGRLCLSAVAAKWLGEALLAAERGELPADGLQAFVKEEREIVTDPKGIQSQLPGGSRSRASKKKAKAKK